MEEHVEHFAPNEWVDFVRNTVVAEKRGPMQAHLEQGCDDCLKMVGTWATVSEFARRELFYEPPTGALRNAESYFHSWSLLLKESPDVCILQHAFDSYDVGELVGIRGFDTAPRQLMYNSYSVFIDLRVEQKSGSDWVALTGQVVDAQLPDGILEEIPVLLFSKDDSTVQTTTNRFGEFNFSFKAIGHLGLLLKMKKLALFLPLVQERSSRASSSATGLA
jgi:hypothetical protein